MCRYAHYPYKPHLACFDCRKTFKRRQLADIKRGATDSVPAKCPECQGLLANMGLDFESPPASDRKAWEHLRNLYAAGVTYHSCGCSGPGYIPATTAALAEYLAERLAGYVQELRYWLTRQEPTTKAEREADHQQSRARYYQLPYPMTRQRKSIDAVQALAYWQQRVSQVENDLNRVKAQLPVS